MKDGKFSVYFTDFVPSYPVENFCVRFEDCLLVKKLIALGRYGKVDDKDGGLLDKARDISQECTRLVLQNFNAIHEGLADPPLPPFTIENAIRTETQMRCYLVERMAKDDVLAKRLIQELSKRIAKYIVIAYDGEPEDIFGMPSNVISQDKAEDIPWVKRTRSALVDQPIKDIPWEILWSRDPSRV